MEIWKKKLEEFGIELGRIDLEATQNEFRKYLEGTLRKLEKLERNL